MEKPVRMDDVDPRLFVTMSVEAFLIAWSTTANKYVTKVPVTLVASKSHKLVDVATLVRT